MDESIFTEVFGRSPKVLVIDYLLDNTLLDFHKSDIAEQTGISRSTLDVFFDELVENKLIVKSRQIGRAQLYKVNKKNSVMRQLMKFDMALTRQSIPGKIAPNIGRPIKNTL